MSDPTEPDCRAALGRAGVRPRDVDRMPLNVITARGALLLNQENEARAALERMDRAVADALRAIGTMGEFFDLQLLSGAGAIQALVELRGLRRGIEFASGSPYDRRLTAVPEEVPRVRQ